MTSPLSGKRLLVLSEDVELGALLAGAVAGLGGEAAAAASGAEALAALRTARPAVAILDLPVGDMGAEPLLGQLSSAGVPAVVVSGIYRGPQAAAQLRRLGARDVLEKPFALETLLGAVAGALGAAAPPAGAGGGEAEDEVTGSIPLAEGAPGTEPFLALDGEEAAAPGAPAGELEGLARPPPDPGSVRRMPPDAAPPTTGQLSSTTTPRLLVALHVGQATGALTLARGPVKKILAVERGALVYAASNLAAERLGALCVRRGIVTAERLSALRQADPGRPTAALLAAAGVLSPDRRARLVAAQLRAIAWSTFSWREGTYRFQAGRPPAGRLPLRAEVGALVLEGLRRTATLPRLRAELPAEAHLAPRPDPAVELYALELLPAEAHLLALADGTKTVADLLRLSDLPERDALAFLQACRTMRILDEVARVLASTRRMGFL